ncbi:hypothetical protein MBANPS3_012353 [Mucor bainieri]
MTTETNKPEELYKVTEELPVIPEESSPAFAKELLIEYAVKNNFMIASYHTDLPRFEFQCEKSGEYRSTRRIASETRQRQTTSSKTNCPHRMRYRRLENGNLVQQTQPDGEFYHKYPLTGRMSILTEEEVKTIYGGIKNNLSPKAINRSVSEGKSYNTLYRHDIANMKVKKAREDARPFGNSDGMVLIDTMKSRGYNVVHHQRTHNDNVNAICFAAEVRSKRKAVPDEELSLQSKARKSEEELRVPHDCILCSAAALCTSLRRWHISIQNADVKEVKSPRCVGICERRAAGQSTTNVPSYTTDKKTILAVLNKYEHRYITELKIKQKDLFDARNKITSGIDRPLKEVLRADKRAIALDSLPNANDDAIMAQLESKAALAKLVLVDPSIEQHHCAVVAPTEFWFSRFRVWSNTGYCLSPPVRFSFTYSGSPAIYHDAYWKKKENFVAMCLTYRNKWGQFPKCVEGRIEGFFGYLVVSEDKPQNASTIVVEHLCTNIVLLKPNDDDIFDVF